MTVAKGSILIVDDDIDILETARMFLKQYFTHIDISQDPTIIPERISRVAYDVILLDMNFRKGRNDGEEGFYWLQRILEYNPDAVIILITAYGEVDLAVKAIKEGATDFVLKPWKNQKLLATVMAGWNLMRSKKEVTRLKETNQRIQHFQPAGILGDSPQMKQVIERIARVADTDANVLIQGENGTGKELVAKALHTQSSRKDMPFIKVDLGAVPESLFEAELFGHKKGAFTDAKEDRSGSLELANGGTLFLDEIANISAGSQAKLLSVLEGRHVRPLGSTEDTPIDVRLVVATNASLPDMVEEGSFRQDLLFRINTIDITLPPLRTRTGDIKLLYDHFFQLYTQKYGKVLKNTTQSVLTSLENYPWPGNVRELQHAVERAVILARDKIRLEDLIADSVSQTHGKPRTLDEMERQFLIDSLEENGGNVTQTARKIGLTRTAMYRRLKKYGL